MMELDIYDFDKTVVPFDSGSSFLIFSFFRYPYLFLLLPYYMIVGLLFGLHIIGLDRFKKHIFIFVRFIPLEKAVKKYWDKREKEVYEWFLPKNRARYTVVISASPDFLLKEIQKRLQIDTLLCTRHHPKNGTLLYNNCRGEEKVRRFYETFPESVTVKCVYSDSYSNDRPIFSLGEQCFHIEKNGDRTPFVYAEKYTD